MEHSPHIICLNETKITEEFSDELLKIDGFQNIIRNDRTTQGGDVAVYVKSDIKFSVRSYLDSELEWISIELNIKYVKLVIYSSYNI